METIETVINSIKDLPAITQVVVFLCTTLVIVYGMYLKFKSPSTNDTEQQPPVSKRSKKRF